MMSSCDHEGRMCRVLFQSAPTSGLFRAGKHAERFSLPHLVGSVTSFGAVVARAARSRAGRVDRELGRAEAAGGARPRHPSHAVASNRAAILREPINEGQNAGSTAGTSRSKPKAKLCRFSLYMWMSHGCGDASMTVLLFVAAKRKLSAHKFLPLELSREPAVDLGAGHPSQDTKCHHCR